ncbi:MAG: ATP-binding cassette domain-containing protein [Nitrospiria bacterium]
MIEIDHLTKRYHSGRLAIDQLCLEVKEHEIFGFLGPNGAGKTTTIRILTTLCLPSEGSARVAGCDVVKSPHQVRRNIGYVAQESGVEYCLTGLENLILQGHLYRLDRKILDRRVAEVLRLFDLEEVKDQMVSQYSGGMRRKLDIAMALLHQPRLLFLDEPTLGLDPQSRFGLWDYIRKINQAQGVTIFLTTHYLEEADKLAHRIGILDMGMMKTMDTPEGLKDSIGGDVIMVALENGLPSALDDQIQQKLRALPFVKELLVVGQECSMYVKQGREALPKILQVMDSAGVPVKAATLSRPSLDDVFLKYTGRRFKEETGQNTGGEWQKWWKPQSSESGESNWSEASNKTGADGGDGSHKWDWKDHASSR